MMMMEASSFYNFDDLTRRREKVETSENIDDIVGLSKNKKGFKFALALVYFYIKMYLSTTSAVSTRNVCDDDGSNSEDALFKKISKRCQMQKEILFDGNVHDLDKYCLLYTSDAADE